MSAPNTEEPLAASTESTRDERKVRQDEIDVRALAERVYRLLRAEARMERERLGRRQTR